MTKNQKNQMLRFRKTALAFALSQILNLSVPVAMAAMIAVDTDSGGANDPNHCTLRDAITAANADAATGGCPAGAGADTIVLPAKATITLTEPDNPDNGLPVVTSAIMIEGNGTTAKRGSSSPQFRIFEVNNGSLELRNIIISGGNIYSKVGGIFAHDSSLLMLIDSAVSENKGGIHAVQSPVTLINSTVLRNSSCSDYYASVGGILAGNSPVTLTNSTVSGNIGGGITAAGYSSVTLTNSIVSGNTACYCQGGGISVFNNSPVTLINSTISENTGCGGGGIDAYNSIVTLMNSTVSGNLTEVDAGGIDAFNSTLILTNSTVTGNSNQSNIGSGGVNLHSYSPYFQPNLILKNSIVANNSGGDCVNNARITPTSTNTLIGDGGINCGTPLLTGDAKLGPLRKNGGPTPTHALLADSPAIDAGDDAICDTLPKNARGQSTDQRGRPRAGPRAGSHCDIGAYEFRHRRQQ